MLIFIDIFSSSPSLASLEDFSLKTVKFSHLFSCALSYSLSSACHSYDFLPEKRRLPNAMLPAKENCLNTPVPIGCPASPPPPQQSVRADVCDIITKISCIHRFPKKSYPRLMFQGPELRYQTSFFFALINMSCG